MNLKYTIICYLLLPLEVQWVLDNQYDYWFRKNIQIIGFLEIEFAIILKMVTRKNTLFWPKIYHCVEVDGALEAMASRFPFLSIVAKRNRRRHSKVLEILLTTSHQLFTLTIWDWLAGSRNVSSKSSFMLRILVIIAPHWIDHLCKEILKNL